MAPERMHKQSKNNKQGSSSDLIEAVESYLVDINVEHRECYDLYQDLLQAGLSRELSRTVLPQSTYTQMIWKCDLHNLFHYLKLRLDCHAQYEIRVYAEAIFELIKPLVPLCVKSWENHVLYAKTFSADELDIIRAVLDGVSLDLSSLSKSRSVEFADKLGMEGGK